MYMKKTRKYGNTQFIYLSTVRTTYCIQYRYRKCVFNNTSTAEKPRNITESSSAYAVISKQEKQDFMDKIKMVQIVSEQSFRIKKV